MPTSRLPKRTSNPQTADPPSTWLRALLLFAVFTVLAVVLLLLPASLLRRFLPPNVTAGEFSGTIWHGSAADLSVDRRSFGAIEWRLHPGSLLGLSVNADLHWVKVGFVADGRLQIDSHGFTVRNAEGGGPLEDLHDLGIARAWVGETRFTLGVLQVRLPQDMNGHFNVLAVTGDLDLDNVSSAQLAAGTNLGGYVLHLADPSLAPRADITAELTDTGGPLALHAAIRLTADGHTGMLSGTVQARDDASPALRREVDTLAELHARDAAGNIPVDLEFTL
jgi:hypothetical protein